jgi:hypothetical protein
VGDDQIAGKFRELIERLGALAAQARLMDHIVKNRIEIELLQGCLGSFNAEEWSSRGTTLGE